mmetsp:Transcript_22173/g.61726  ORF Transcript_22173/g.61726 Transcript_22173/m.61726 type:complete len:399 (+) Transcript_22173:327-1523(+)
MASSTIAKMSRMLARSRSLALPRIRKERNLLIRRSSIVTRHSSVFSRLIQEHDNALKSTESRMDRRKKKWHCPSFMSCSNISEKEAWLEDLLAKTNAARSIDDMIASGSEMAAESAIDVEAFLVVLKALASIDAIEDAGAPRRADMWMNRLSKLSNSHLQPTSECYQYVIQAWANSNKEQTIVIRNRSQRWFDELVSKSGDNLLSSMLLPTYDNSRRRADFVAIEPTIGCFNAFLDGLSRGRQGKTKRHRQILLDNAKMGEAILRRLHSLCSHRVSQEGYQKGKRVHGESQNENAGVIRPNTDTFNFVIRGWTRCKHEAFMHERVLAILRLMESYQRENPAAFIVDRDAPRPNTKSYSMAMDALISEAKRKARHYNNQMLRQKKKMDTETRKKRKIRI